MLSHLSLVTAYHAAIIRVKQAYTFIWHAQGRCWQCPPPEKGGNTDRVAYVAPRVFSSCVLCLPLASCLPHKWLLFFFYPLTASSHGQSVLPSGGPGTTPIVSQQVTVISTCPLSSVSCSAPFLGAVA